MPGSPLEHLRAHLADAGGRLYLGASGHGLVLADPEQAALVLGPPRSGKTTSLAIPNVLCAPGAVVATSTKPDLLSATLDARAQVGRCWLLDPSGTAHDISGVSRLRWSPVAGAVTWDESLVLARAMAGAARPAGRRGESAHWTERAEALLAPLLYAAHLGGTGMDSVVHWVLRQDLDTARAILVARGVDLGADVLAGIAATDPREQSGIWSSTAGILATYRSEAALDSADAVNFDPRALVGTSDTVYVCAAARYQELVAPIVVAFLEEARAGAYEAWRGRASGRPLTLVLDEVANIAPLPDLPALVSEGGGQGVLTLACLQDLSQATERWGAAASGFMSLFGAKVVLPGIADLSTLELISRLGGEVDVPQRSVSRATWWAAWGTAPTETWSAHRQRQLPVESVREIAPGQAILLAGARAPEVIGVPPWWGVSWLTGPHLSGPHLSEQQLTGPRAVDLPGRDLGQGR